MFRFTLKARQQIKPRILLGALHKLRPLTLISASAIVARPSPPASSTICREAVSSQSKAGEFTLVKYAIKFLLEPFRHLILLVRCTLRAAAIILLMTPLLLSSAYLLLISGGRIHNFLQARYSRLLKSTLLSLGPTFIKLGQWGATRPDLFSLEVCEELSDLHDRVSSSIAKE